MAPGVDPSLLSCGSASLGPWKAGHRLPAVRRLPQLCLGEDSASNVLIEGVWALRANLAVILNNPSPELGFSSPIPKRRHGTQQPHPSLPAMSS